VSHLPIARRSLTRKESTPFIENKLHKFSIEINYLPFQAKFAISKNNSIWLSFPVKHKFDHQYESGIDCHFLSGGDGWMNTELREIVLGRLDGNRGCGLLKCESSDEPGSTM
jgi:hypothetical protein